MVISTSNEEKIIVFIIVIVVRVDIDNFVINWVVSVELRSTNICQVPLFNLIGRVREDINSLVSNSEFVPSITSGNSRITSNCADNREVSGKSSW